MRLSSFLLAIAFAAPLVTAQEPASDRSAAVEPTPGRQVEQSLTVGDTDVPYLCYLPQDYAKSDSKVPLLLFLHGRGESNGPLSKVASWGPAKYLAAGEQLPYVVLSPQCPKTAWWADDGQQALLIALLDHAEKTWRIDPQRIVVTGLSMGGYGTWRLCADHPARFAAAAPICGAGEVAWAPRLTKLPIWAWHGTVDRAVPHEKSVVMVEAIQKAGGDKVLFTSLEHVGHNSWEAAYRSPDLWRWFDAQRNETRR